VVALLVLARLLLGMLPLVGRSAALDALDEDLP
jgi:hypothetical protein